MWKHCTVALLEWVCNSVMRAKLLQESKKGSLDFVFVDADKDNYLNYHKRVIELVKIGGLIGYDNTLWHGSVAAPPDAPMDDFVKTHRAHMIELNKYLAQDSRIEICQLPVGDGLTLCRRMIWSFLPIPWPPFMDFNFTGVMGTGIKTLSGIIYFLN